MNSRAPRPAKVLIDVRFLAGRATGVGRYLMSLLTQISAIAPPGLEPYALCLPGQTVSRQISQHVLKGVGARAKPLGPIQQIVLPLAIRNTECDLFHYTYIDPPRGLPPFVATCYDIEPLRHPELFRRKIVWYYRVFAPGLRAAERVIVISQNTARDVVELLGIDPNRVKVIYLGVDPHFRPVRDAARMDGIRSRYNLPTRYVLYLGNTMPHKNLVRLVNAMTVVHQRFPTVPLLLAGRKDKYRPVVEQAIAAASGPQSIRFLGEIAEDDLPALLSGAAVFAYPSLYEGFGLPVLEAMACGTPVVTSSRSSLPEIVGDSAVIVDPYDVSSLANAILRLLENPEEAARFSELGQIRAKGFTWRRCAQQHLDVYREVLNH